MGRVKEAYQLGIRDPEDFNLDQLYFEWLCRIVGVEDPPPQFGSETHRFLCDVLHQIQFYAVVHNDENRIIDARDLRDHFLEQEDYAGFFTGDILFPISVFEVLVALCIRCEKTIHNDDFGDRTAFWFHSILENADFLRFSDERWEVGASKLIEREMYYILEHLYKRNGTGSFFPLRRTRKDQRQQELWFQMVSWLNENYREEFML